MAQEVEKRKAYGHFFGGMGLALVAWGVAFLGSMVHPGWLKSLLVFLGVVVFIWGWGRSVWGCILLGRLWLCRRH